MAELMEEAVETEDVGFEADDEVGVGVNDVFAPVNVFSCWGEGASKVLVLGFEQLSIPEP